MFLVSEADATIEFGGMLDKLDTGYRHALTSFSWLRLRVSPLEVKSRDGDVHRLAVALDSDG